MLKRLKTAALGAKNRVLGCVKTAAVATGAMVAAVSTGAHATADTAIAATTTALGTAATDVSTVGGAVLAIAVVVVTFRYIKRAF